MTFRALLFDFDGVLADTEPVHFEMFRKILASKKIPLAWETYQARYLGLDDHACFRSVFRDLGKRLPPEREALLVREKNRLLLEFVRGRSLLLPGVRETIGTLAGGYFLAIVSGARRNEIETILGACGLGRAFRVIVGADQVKSGKPDPEGFLLAMKLLNRDHIPESEILIPAECLAIEDSPWGIEAAKKAGLRSVAVTTSYPKEKVGAAGAAGAADWILSNLSELPGLLAKIS